MMKHSVDFFAVYAAILLLSWSSLAQADEPESAKPSSQVVKISAVQISGYDKGDLPRDGVDVVATLLPYIDRAKKEGA
ncbi:MAG: hypothetical protein GWQ05_10130, partial [Verrucomicrobiaceae bacterium]|nr:hypothetical protein [Verrucomicrobiaceae bacterium]